MTFLICAKCGFKPRSSDPLDLQLKVMKHHIEQWHKLTDGTTSTTSNNQRWVCRFCDFTFCTQIEMAKHIVFHHKEGASKSRRFPVRYFTSYPDIEDLTTTNNKEEAKK